MLRESFDQHLLAGKKVSFTFAISIRKILKSKEWNAGGKPEKKSLRSTLTYFNDDYFFKKRQ